MKKAPLLKRLYYKAFPPEDIETIYGTIPLVMAWETDHRCVGSFLNVPMKNSRKGLIRLARADIDASNSSQCNIVSEYEFYYYLN